MRVVVNIPPGSHPELLRELEQTPPRERAERLRMLATIGLLNMGSPGYRGQPAASPDPQTMQTEPNPEMGSPVESDATRRKNQLKSRLRLGL
jgi:hypothetical protein